MTIKRHSGLPPAGWEMVPGMTGYIRQKTGQKSEAPRQDLSALAKALESLEKVQGKNGEQGPPGRDGKDGKDGAPGKDGSDGKDGRPGRDGKDGAPGKQGPKGDRGERGPAGKDGKDGKDGQDGVSFKDLKIHGTDMLVMLSDGKEKRYKLPTGGGGTPFGGAGNTATISGDPNNMATSGSDGGVLVRQNVYVQDSEPTFAPGQVGLWVQTGMGADGTGFTLWFEDGL